jgi:cell division protein FtsI (penicillin-binding protein 3)
MAGEKRIKSPAGSSVSRRGSRNRTRGSASRSVATGNRERRNAGRASKARVIQFPQGRRPRRSRLPDRRKVGSAGGRGRVRLILGAVVVVCVSLSLEGRAVQLSVAKDDRYQAFTTEANAEERSGVATSSERTGRGSIVSADGRYLAMSLDTAKVIATPYQVEEPEEAAEALSEVLGEDAGTATEIEEKLVEKNDEDGPSGYSVVAEDVEPETAREVKRLGLSGISTAPDERRVYPNGALASQLVGYLGTDKAYGGVEARYDDLLKSGEEVRLTLDTAVQQELEGALLQTAEEYEGKRALGLVMRVEDGAVVALAHTPGYDNNEFGEASEEAKRSRVLTDPHEPGSTFKAFTMAAAIEEKAVNEESTFVVADSIPVADVLIHDSEAHETKVMNTRNILEHSSNVGTIQVAQLLGGERLVEHIERFGFGEGTGVDLWGEDPGRVPPFEEWSGSSIGNIPVGQGLSATPLQLAAGYVSLANGGLKVTPHVAEQAAPDEPGRRVISKETSSIVRGMLQSVVDEGTGHLAQIPGYTVAGKTGTAQKVDPETGLYGNEYVTSFIGFAPAEDPKYLALIVVDEPQKDLFGEVVAAPAFQDVMGFTLGYFNVPLNRESTKADPPPPDPTPAPNARKEDRLR